MGNYCRTIIVNCGVIDVLLAENHQKVLTFKNILSLTVVKLQKIHICKIKLLTRYKRNIELSEPLFEQSSWYMSIGANTHLPLVEPTLYTHHFVKISWDSKDSFRSQAIQGCEKHDTKIVGCVRIFTEYLFSKSCQDPWKTSAWKLVLLNSQGFKKCATEH